MEFEFQNATIGFLKRHYKAPDFFFFFFFNFQIVITRLSKILVSKQGHSLISLGNATIGSLKLAWSLSSKMPL